jgi:glycosyltransferase involved in cell wall biosynthesis
MMSSVNIKGNSSVRMNGQDRGLLPRFVLITPAHNEEALIKKTIESVISQTILPMRWVIVDDGSTDRTAEIVQGYAKQFRWIELIQRPQRQDRNFADKAHAFNAGFERVRSFQFEVIGNLDADISFERDYFEFMLTKFDEFPQLGVAGTAMREASYDAIKDSFYHASDVFGACQLFRRECFEEVGGYTPIKCGGIDWIAVRTARLKGWQTKSFCDKLFYHHRPMGETGSTTWKARFDYGRKEYLLGNHPFWQIFRVSYQMLKRPYLIGGLLLFSGYVYAFACRMKRPVDAELLKFHRKEQLSRLKCLFVRLLKTGRLELHRRS